MKIEIDDDLILECLTEHLSNKQVLRDAMSKAIAQSKIVDRAAGELAAKIHEQAMKAVTDPALVEGLREIIREELAKSLSGAVKVKSAELARDELRRVK